MWFSNPKSCGQGCFGRIFSIKGLQGEYSSRVMRNVCRQIKMETREMLGTNKVEKKTVDMEDTTLMWFLIKLSSIDFGRAWFGYFAVVVTCKVYLFLFPPPPK